jgi:catechol 2,3-dioxygenase-like lactoylglutathione lyase family enzyme
MSETRSPLWEVQPAVRLDRRDPYLLLQHVALFVRDQQRSLRFLVDCLGFSVALDHHFPDGSLLGGDCPSGWNGKTVSSSSALPRPCWGCLRNGDCVLEERQLCPGDTLLLYTDGATEAFNDADEEFREKRLIEALRRYRGRSSQTVIASLVDEIHQFSPREQQDDITLIVANVRDDLATI